MEKLIAISKNVIAIGDLNFNMISDTDFTTVCNSFDLVNLVTTPTCFKGNPSILDVILVNNPTRFKNTSNLKCPVSDHHNILCTASKIILPLTVPNNVYNRSMKKFNVDAFIEDLSYSSRYTMRF